MNWHRGMLQDIHYACRGFLARRTFFFMIAMLLSLGVGATTAIFTLVNSLAFQTLPIPNPHRLVIVQRHMSQFNIDATAFNYPTYRELQRRSRSFAGLLARWPVTVDMTVRNATQRIQAELVSGGYFRTLGLFPAMGRALSEEDDGSEGSSAVCMISYQMWRDQFGSDPQILSQVIHLNGNSFRIIGVAPWGFNGTVLHNAAHIYIPMSMTGVVLPNSSRDTVRWSWLNILGRLESGVSIEQAETELGVIGSQLVEEGLTPPAPSGINPWRLASAPEGFDLEAKLLVKPALLLLGGTALLLLITCLNVAGLLISRISGRLREMSIRLALGGGRWRIARMLMTESAILGVVTFIAGGVVAVILTRLFTIYAHSYRPELLLNLNPDARVLCFSVGLTLVAVLAVGIIPALYITRASATTYLRPSQGISRQTHVLWRALITAQVGASVVLLFSAGLLSRTVENLRSVPLGIDLDGLTVLSISPSKAGYKAADAQRLVETVLSRLRAVPQVSDASAATIGVLSGDMFAIDVTVPGHVTHGEEANTYINSISSGYFRSLGIPLLNGRDFGVADTIDGTKVAIINKTMANHYWPGQSAVGQWLERGKNKVEVVGVVADSKYDTLRSAAPPVIHFPLAQEPFDSVVINVRSNFDLAELTGIVQQILNQNAQGISIFGITTMRSQRNILMATENLIGNLSLLFGIAAVILSMTGVYGLISSLTASRRKEISIRVAIGSSSSRILRIFIRDGALAMICGLAIGIPLSMYTGKIFQSILFEIEPGDLGTLVSVVIISCATVLLAVMLPVWRALRLDPAVILRYE